MKPLDFIETARELAGNRDTEQPRETNLRRAVSTAYYALFRCLAECCADMLARNGSDGRMRASWRQTYRAPNHRTARDRCEHSDRIKEFPVEIRKFAEQFVRLQKKRHRADYDPGPLDFTREFSRSGVLLDISTAESVIRNFAHVSETERRAFAVYLLIRPERKD